MTQIQPPTSPVPPAPQSDDSARVSRAINLAAELFEAPAVTGARFVGRADKQSSSSTLLVSLSQRSLSGLTKRSATQSLVLGGPDSDVVATTPVSFTSEEVKHVSLSPDGSRQAVFRQIAAKDGKPARKVVEIVRVLDGRKEDELDLSNEHGDFYFDSTFGSASWHPSSTSLVYTAEAPSPKPDPSATRPSAVKFEYTPDFGETFTGRREPTLFLLVLADSSFQGALQQDEPTLSTQDAPTQSKPALSVHRLTSPNLAGPVVFGQAAFLPNTDRPRLVATGYAPLGDGRKLGIVYCTNRRARIYALEVKAEHKAAADDEDGHGDDADMPKVVFRTSSATPISSASRSARSPRVLPLAADSHQTARVVYISNALGGPHASCAALELATLSASLSVDEARTVVDVVDEPSSSSGDAFPGLYVDQLPHEPFVVVDGGGAQGEVAVAMTSVWRTRRVPLVVGLESGRVTSLAPWPERRTSVDAALPYLYLGDGKGEGKSEAGGDEQEQLESFSVLGTDGQDRVVALRSGPGSPPRLVVAHVQEGSSARWKVLKDAPVSHELTSALSRISYTILPLPKFEPTELVLVSPIPIDPAAESSVNLPPLVVIPHGGPHGASTTDWSYATAALVLAGYRVVLVNYPGSVGYGQRYIDELPARIGELEVEATLGAAHYLNALSLASRTRGKKLLMGGSHGGFIASHLTARWPDEFDAVVQRNPVTDLVANSSNSDIPEWQWLEAGLPYSFDGPPTHVDPATHKRFYDVSPLRHAHQVKTPTLLLIGLDDRRVPSDQGRAWFHALKSRPDGAAAKVDVEMLAFPGNGHPIDSTVEAEWCAFEAGVEWLARYTSWD
ncbi:hypothetical protein JCM3775_003237 [Rhodotorula graminis]|uniref:acylaminoacyl-peptidase n=1 Tax=Rhodotorula graminis (strain WP1) TaxID=578459 RepID=A0A0P9GJS3_RHOGW|nr:uncharacterized protein RHOBADRAFT_55065 [Rhodotorula graminis WP1]KPV73303.1 hypothetical protein RHOBADRAFT_55065 [Rhodotorula graminis WP1]